MIWHGVEENEPDFSPQSKTLAFALDGSQTGREPDHDFYIVCNAWLDAIAFHIPQSPSGSPWGRVIDTSLPPPHDIVEEQDALLVNHGSKYSVAAHSMLVLITKKSE